MPKKVNTGWFKVVFPDMHVTLFALNLSVGGGFSGSVNRHISVQQSLWPNG